MDENATFSAIYLHIYVAASRRIGVVKSESLKIVGCQVRHILSVVVSIQHKERGHLSYLSAYMKMLNTVKAPLFILRDEVHFSLGNALDVMLQKCPLFNRQKVSTRM